MRVLALLLAFILGGSIGYAQQVKRAPVKKKAVANRPRKAVALPEKVRTAIKKRYGNAEVVKFVEIESKSGERMYRVLLKADKIGYTTVDCRESGAIVSERKGNLIDKAEKGAPKE